MVPYQQYGGYGQLGNAFQAAVQVGGSQNIPSVLNLLSSAYAFNSNALGIAKFYFANGTTSGTTAVISPSGYNLPAVPGGANSTYDAYYLSHGYSYNANLGPNQYGSTRPVQFTSVSGPNINVYDPQAIINLTTNPAFPSGHTTYAFTDSILLGMLSPQYFQSMLLRGSEYANSRISLGVHYPLDIIASRSFVQYNLVQLLNATSTTNPYFNTNVTSSAAPINGTGLNGSFVTAASQYNSYISNYVTTNQTTLGCNTVANCAANNPYNTYSAQTYAYQAAAEGVTSASTSATNAAIFEYRQNYGLPTLSFTAAPRELTDGTSNPATNSAAILLSTLYGGQGNTQAQALANAVTGGNTGAGILANLTTDTINHIIQNTETQALSAFYGTQLSYWSRIDLYDAARYFSNVQGTITLASTDVVNINVTVTGTSGNAGVLGGAGTINGDVTVQAGGTIEPGQTNLTPKTALNTTGQVLTVNGNVTFNAGSTFAAAGHVNGGQANTDSLFVKNGALNIQNNAAGVTLYGVYIPGVTYTLINVDKATGTMTGAFGNGVHFDSATAPGSLSSFLTPTLQYQADPAIILTVQSNFAAAAKTPNQSAVATAIDNYVNHSTPTGNGVTLLADLIANNTAATAPLAFNQLSGEGITGQQQAALNAGNVFVNTVLGQVTYWEDRENNIFGLKDGGSKDGPACSMKDGYACAIPTRARFWAAGFGQYASLDGQGSTGSASVSSNNAGVATGIDYELTPNWIGGIAGGYSNSNFSVSSRDTTGTVEGGHFAVYGVGHYGNFYAAGTTTFNWYNNTTDRQITALGGLEVEKGSSSSNEWVSRGEFGYKNLLPSFTSFTVTPFTGYQFAQLSNDAFSETNPGVAGLHVNGQTINSEKAFLGVQFDTQMAVGNGWVLAPYARVSWEYEFNTDRRMTASFLALPSAAFTEFGAQTSQDIAHVNTGFKLDINPNVAVFASFDGEFSDRSDIYSGTGGIRIRW